MFPKLKVLPTSRQTVDVFKGYNRNLRIGEGEFFDMKNMTSDFYPVAAPRGKRGVYGAGESLQGIIAKDRLCYVDGTDFVIGSTRIDLGLSTAEEDCPKSLVSMGAYVIILPDKKYINTADTTDFGDIEASFASTENVSFSLCDLYGKEYQHALVSAEEPEWTEDFLYDVWYDASSYPWVPKVYNQQSRAWVTIATLYIKIATKGIGKDFAKYDGVTVSGIVSEHAKSLNGKHVIQECGDDYIIVTGVMETSAFVTQMADEGAVRVARTMPDMDFVIESGNRLWGCCNGKSKSKGKINEIYASKLGDFKNWNCFMGLSTDSYVASCGTDGPFTGAITHMGQPVFFKENCMHKVYGDYPSNFRVQATTCRGVQKGCEKSLAIVNETLFYKSISGVCAYDGSLPVEVSYALGAESYSQAVAGALRNKYYISMKDDKERWHLFVYDTANRLWHREDDFRALDFCCFRGELYGIDTERKGIMAMTGTGAKEPDAVEWMAETGILGTDMPDMKYISRLALRMSLDLGSRVRILIQYDSMGGWEHICTLVGRNLRSFTVPIRPRRCDHLRLRIEGTGDARIYSITKTIEQGSDVR